MLGFTAGFVVGDFKAAGVGSGGVANVAVGNLLNLVGGKERVEGKVGTNSSESGISFININDSVLEVGALALELVAVVAVMAASLRASLEVKSESSSFINRYRLI